MIRGKKYRFKGQADSKDFPHLMFVGWCPVRQGRWYEFTKYKDGKFGKVWLQANESDLKMLERVEE